MSKEAGSALPAAEAARVPAVIKAIPVRHPWRWVSAAVVLAVAAAIAHAFAVSPYIRYGIIAKYQFSSEILSGLELTVVYTVLAEGIGIILGILAAVMRLSQNPVLSIAASFYVWLFRGVPILVQILLWYNIALVFPRLGIGIPFTHIWVSAQTNSILTTFVAAVVALSLNEGAYMAEIVRAGIISIDLGQSHAAQALGMSPAQTMRRIVLPQALRVIVPPTGNDFVSMLKTTSLVSVISGAELLTKVQEIYSQNFRTMELLFVASIWYLALTTVASIGQHFLEARLARGTGREVRYTMWERIRHNLALGRVR